MQAYIHSQTQTQPYTHTAHAIFISSNLLRYASCTRVYGNRMECASEKPPKLSELLYLAYCTGEKLRKKPLRSRKIPIIFLVCACVCVCFFFWHYNMMVNALNDSSYKVTWKEDLNELFTDTRNQQHRNGMSWNLPLFPTPLRVTFRVFAVWIFPFFSSHIFHAQTYKYSGRFLHSTLFDSLVVLFHAFLSLIACSYVK